MNELSIEYIYEIIVNWDEGGGKRSRRELARRIHSELYSPSVQPGWCKGCTPEACPGCGEANVSKEMRELERKSAEAFWASYLEQKAEIEDLREKYSAALRELYEFQEATGCDTAAEFVAAPAAPATLLTGCNCRWQGDDQVAWCELHAAHKEAIHDWAERAKTAEAKLAAPAAPAPLTDEQIKKMRTKGDDDFDDWPEAWSYRQGVRDAEAAHGIGKGGAA
jgi:hypothetical protein